MNIAHKISSKVPMNLLIESAALSRSLSRPNSRQHSIARDEILPARWKRNGSIRVIGAPARGEFVRRPVADAKVGGLNGLRCAMSVKARVGINRINRKRCNLNCISRCYSLINFPRDIDRSYHA